LNLAKEKVKSKSFKTSISNNSKIIGSKMKDEINEQIIMFVYDKKNV